MRKNVLLMSLMALFLFGCSTSELYDTDLVDDTVTLSDSNSLTAKGIANAPASSGIVDRFIQGLGLIVIDEDTGLTALFGWHPEPYWPFRLDDSEQLTWQWGGSILLEGEIGTIVLEGALDWPDDEPNCDNCAAYFASNPEVLAEGTSHFTFNATLNTQGNSFNGKLLTVPNGDPVMLSAKYKINGGNGKVVQSIKLQYK